MIMGEIEDDGQPQETDQTADSMLYWRFQSHIIEG